MRTKRDNRKGCGCLRDGGCANTMVQMVGVLTLFRTLVCIGGCRLKVEETESGQTCRCRAIGLCYLLSLSRLYLAIERRWASYPCDTRPSLSSFAPCHPCRPAPSATRRSSCMDEVCISKPGKAGVDGQFAHRRWKDIRRAAGPNQTEAARAISAPLASLFRKATHPGQSNAAMSYRCVKAGSTIVLDFYRPSSFGAPFYPPPVRSRRRGLARAPPIWARALQSFT
jgi:hypothetical protein